MSKCKYCNLVELVWPENYVKGMKPLEEDTHVEHNFERCQEVQGKKTTPKKTESKRGWIKKICDVCSSKFMFHTLHYTEKTAIIDCETCKWRNKK